MTFPMPTFMPSGALSNVAQQASASATDAASITAPADINAGDLLVFVNRGQNGGNVPSSVTPSGFTNIFDFSDGSRLRLTLFYKIATGSEASSSLSAMTADFSNIVLVTFRGSTAISTATPTFSNGGLETGNPTAQTVDVTGLAVPLIVCGVYCGDGSVEMNPTFTVGGSDAKDGIVDTTEPTGSKQLALAWKVYNTSSSDTVSIDMDDSGTRNVLGSGRFILT